MKNFFIAFAAASILIAGCSDASTDPTSTYYMRADVNGQSFEAHTLEATIVANQIVIAGESNDGRHLEIQLKDTDIQEFDLGADSYNKAWIDLGSGSDDRYETKFHLGNGRVVITRRVPTEMMGYFQFTGLNADSQTVNVERGNFRVRLSR